jgi:hypothetical protein
VAVIVIDTARWRTLSLRLLFPGWFAVVHQAIDGCVPTRYERVL